MRCCANTSGSWRSSQRSLGATSCWLMPLPVRRTNAAGIDLGGELRHLAARCGRRSAGCCAGAAGPPASEQHDRRQHAGDADGGDVAQHSGLPSRAARRRWRSCCPTTARGPPRPSPAVPNRGRPAAARAPASRPSSSIRMPIVEVVPMSMPRSQRHRSAQLRDRVHEPLDAVAVDRRSRCRRRSLKWVPITQPSATSRMCGDIVDVDAGVGEHRPVAAPPP